ncbi:MAG: AI-2E family transporter [Actinomycetaceae bacterium]|nr:AI-2E family transporter [Actinomycetaceae bacterium]
MTNTRKTRRVGELFERFSEPIARARSKIEPEPPQVRRFVYPTATTETPSELVPWTLRVAAAWSWRSLVVIAALAVAGWAFSYLTMIFIPVLIALLFAVLLDPVNRFLQKKFRFPRALSAAVSLILGISLVFGLISAASSQILAQFGDLAFKVSEGIDRLMSWLSEGPLQLNATAVEQYIDSMTSEITDFLQDNGSQLASGALSVTMSLGNAVTGFLIAMFVLFFFLKDGRRIWLWFVRLVPQAARLPIHESAIRGWITLGAYARTQILVAAIDAIGIGLGAYFLGVPLAIPIAVLVFIGSFIPIVGAIVTGGVAVLVALVDQGINIAALMLLVILAVQQIESNLLQPWLMSNAVSLHPVAVLLAVAAGSFLFGIPGALFSVPIVAFLNTSMLYFHGYDKFPQLAQDNDRPGGPPGTLDRQILATYDSTMMKIDPTSSEGEHSSVIPDDVDLDPETEPEQLEPVALETNKTDD